MKFLFNGLLYIARRWGLHIIALVGISFLLLLVHRKAYESYSNDERFRINLDVLQVMANPEWLTGTELEPPVKSSLTLNVNTSIFDKSIVSRIRSHYEANPWVARVDSIEKRYPNEIAVKLEIRKPLVAVEVKRTKNRSYYYLVDEQSVRLPGEYAKLPELPVTLPIIVGVNTAPPAAGIRWNDRGLNDALAVAATMENYQLYAKLDIGQIDVSNSGGRRNPKESEITLWTKDKIAIQWGRAPNTDKYGELSVEEKVKNLNYVLSIAPKLQGIKYVKIQFHNPCIALNDQPNKK
ncbi:MAG: hypothetical protein WC980_05185 [Candidatus Brocadiia bacterium]